MKINFVSFTGYLYSLGLPGIIKTLRMLGHDVGCVNVIIDPKRDLSSDMNAIIELVKDSDLVGFSLFSCYHAHAVELTKAIKKKNGNIPIVWGGVHPTFMPELSLETADFICIGEGDEVFPEFVESLINDKNNQVDNIWFKRRNKVIKTPIRPLKDNLDTYPSFDYNHEKFYRIENGRIWALMDNANAVRKYYGTNFNIITSRGCIFRCAYCSNDARNNLYGKNYRKIRRLSSERVLHDLEMAKRHLPFIEFISFVDDEFVSQGDKELESFCQSYKKRIGLPFFALSNPISLNSKKLDVLIEAGMKNIQIGVQTGSSRIQKLYRRPVSNERVIAISNLIEKYKGRLIPTYDFILDNPWESDEDKEDSLELLIDIKEPKKFNFCRLLYLPGTTLQKKALDEGIISADEIFFSHFRIIKNSFYNSLMILTGHFKMSKNSVKILLRWKNYTFFNWFLSHSTFILFSFYLLIEAFKDKHQFCSIFNYLRVYIVRLYHGVLKKIKN